MCITVVVRGVGVTEVLHPIKGSHLKHQLLNLFTVSNLRSSLLKKFMFCSLPDAAPQFFLETNPFTLLNTPTTVALPLVSQTKAKTKPQTLVTW